MAKKKQPEQLEAEPLPERDYPTQETMSRFPPDIHLRRHGFRIHARVKDTEPIWELGGKLYRQEEALVLCDK